MLFELSNLCGSSQIASREEWQAMEERIEVLSTQYMDVFALRYNGKDKHILAAQLKAKMAHILATLCVDVIRLEAKKVTRTQLAAKEAKVAKEICGVVQDILGENGSSREDAWHALSSANQHPGNTLPHRDSFTLGDDT